MVEESRLEEFISKAQEAYIKGVEVLQDLSGWQKIKENNGVSGYTRPNEDTNFDSLKVEWFLEKAPRDCGRYIYDNFAQLNEEFEPEDIASFKMVKEINENVRLFEVRLDPKGPVSGRFLTTCAVWLELQNDTYAQVGVSVDTGVQPPEGYVKGELKLAVYIYEPVGGDANKCHFSSVTLIDPKGSIPSFIVNSVLGNRTSMFEHIIERLSKTL